MNFGCCSKDFEFGVAELVIGRDGTFTGAILPAAKVDLDAEGRLELETTPFATGPDKLTGVQSLGSGAPPRIAPMRGGRERFPLREEERRRAWAGTASMVAGIGAAALVAAYVGVRLTTAGQVLHEYLRLILPAAVPILLVLGVGLWVRLRPRHYVEVDPSRGMVTVFRDGEVRRRVPLSGIGPLRQTREERVVRRGKRDVTVTFHVARSGTLRELCLHASEDEAATRRVLESRAKAWNLPYVTATRETRGPEELDVPIHDRLVDDEAARTHLPQRAGSRLTVHWTGSGYEITTSYAPPVDRKRILWMFLAPAGVLVANFFVFLDLLDPEVPAFYRVFLALVVVWLLSAGPHEVVKRWRRIHRPPVIRISPAGFEFRGERIPLRSIEDVARAPGAVCRVVSDERIVEVEGDFCEPSERDWLRHEIRRLVIELAPGGPR